MHLTSDIREVPIKIVSFGGKFPKEGSGERQKSILFLFNSNMRCAYSVKLARVVGVSVGRHSGGQLATMLVATKNVIIFLSPPVFFSPSSPFLIEGVLGSKNVFSESDSKCPIT